MTAVPAMMRAAYISELGPAENIRVGMVALPTPDADTVLVRVHACAVNHVDTFVRSGAYRTPIPLPFIVGRDLVGTVTADAGGFVAGQLVWCNSLGYQGRQGACAEFAAVPSTRLYRLPSGVDPREAVAVFHPAATALLGLQHYAQIASGDTVVVNGSGGAVGSAVAQIAVACGADVIAIDRPEHSRWATQCGAAAVIDRDDPKLFERLQNQAGKGIDIFWDSTGRPDFAKILPLMACGGRIIIVAGLDASCVLPLGALYTRDVVVRGFTISNATAAALRVAAQIINELLPKGIVRPRSIVEFDLEQVAAAHHAQESRRYPCRRLIVRV